MQADEAEPNLNTSLGYRKLPEFFYHDVESPGVTNAGIVALNIPLASSLCLTGDWLRSDGGLDILSGQTSLGGGKALAMAYGGHQFGSWSGLLGDGRARLVGDLPDKNGLYHELHLKGAGKTPFSRRGDGKATLGSAIREYVVSEAMAALGVPTTRALSIITTGETIIRNGPEPGAIICRTGRSHIRVGTFQIAAASGKTENVQALADFAIERLYPGAPESGPKRYSYFLRRVIAAQAGLVAKWMGLGFIHGVMNTDNAAISGETIDYGPCAFMDDFHPGKVFSSIDRNGRYAWNRQPEIAHWNMARLAESLLPLLGDTEDAQLAVAQADLDSFTDRFSSSFHTVMARKFGLSPQTIESSGFLPKTIKAMTSGGVDFTMFFRELTRIAKGAEDRSFVNLFNVPEHGTEWLELWRSDLHISGGLDDTRIALMEKANPVIIPRNHRVEDAISDANAGNFETFETLMEAVTKPFEDRPGFARFERPPAPDEIVHQTFCGT